MALSKTIPTPYGDATYWKVHYLVDTRLSLVAVTLKGYKDSDAESSGECCYLDVHFSPTQQDVPLTDKSPSVSDIYTWIKTIDGSDSHGMIGGGYDWTDATDI